MKTGILFFTVSATKEARRKTWHPNFDVNLKIANHLISSTRKKLLATGISIIEIKENQQRGSSFGSKLSQTIKDSFELGYDQLIVVGNDSPDLTPQILLKAADSLVENSIVFGPDNHGGIYLIALSKQTFLAHEKEIAQLPWQQNNLLEKFKSRFSKFGMLPLLASINNHNELGRFFSNKTQFTTTQLVLKHLADCQKEQIFRNDNCKEIAYSFDSHFSRRGPPVVFS